MHILIIPSEEFLPNGSTTIGIFQYHQAKVLKDAGHKVGVISISQSFSVPMLLKGSLYKLMGKKTGNACDDYSLGGLLRLGYQKIFGLHHFISTETVRGIEVLRIDGFYHRPPVENMNHQGWIKAGLVAYGEYVKRNGLPEVIHAHNAIYAGMLAEAIGKRSGVPFVITEHSTAYARKTLTDPRLLQRIRSAYNSAAVLTCVSRPFCDLLNQQFSFNRFQCLHNVLDPDFESFTAAKRSLQQPFTFINIAELHPKKDHANLIKAFKQVWLANPNVRLHIGGDGDLSNELRVLVNDEGLQNAVSFLGPLKRPQVFEALSQSDCFVLTSKYETFGVVVIEAMLVGKPVIATACGGPESFITPETGLVIEKENLTALVAAMTNMLQEADKYDSESIRQFALKNFGAAAFVRNVTGYYQQAIGAASTEPKKVATKHPEFETAR